MPRMCSNWIPTYLSGAFHTAVSQPDIPWREESVRYLVAKLYAKQGDPRPVVWRIRWRRPEENTSKD